MLATHLTQFLKNIFELLERRNVDLEKSDENIMYYFVGFLLNVFKNCVSTVDGMQLSKPFKASIVKDLHEIRGGILKLITHLSAEVKLADGEQEFEIYNSKNKAFIKKSFTRDLFTNHSTQLDDYYWNSEYFVSFNVVQESDTPHDHFEKPILKNEDLKTFQHVVNDIKHNKTQTMSKHAAGSKNNVSNVETSKKEIEKVAITRQSLSEKSVKIKTSVPNVSIGALSIPESCCENLTSTISGIGEDQSRLDETRDCALNRISVININTLDSLDAKDSSHSTRYITILHLSNLAVINTSFAIDKMAFNSIIKEETQYKCLLCSVYTAATVEGLNNHLQSPLHINKLAKDIIWVSSLDTCVKTVGINRYQCCICLKSGAIKEMTEHFKSRAHKQSFSSTTAACSSILEAMENAAENKQMDTTVLMSNFETVLRQHKMKLCGKQLSCNTCGGKKIPTSLYNLYTHIAGQQHWCSYVLQLKKCFTNWPKISNVVDQTYKGFISMYNSKNKCYCQICKIFIDGVTINMINSHIKSYAHYKFLILFLKNDKISSFIDLNEGGQKEGEEFSLPDASRGKQDTNPSKAELKTDTSKTIIDDSIHVHDTGSYVILNYNIAIDKYSWNGIKMCHSTYLCAPCDVAAPVSECSMHIEGDSHKTRLGSCPLNSKHLMRMMKNNISLFCLVCGDWVQEEGIDHSLAIHHSLAEHHKARMEQLAKKCENWKTEMSHNFAEVLWPSFSKANRYILVDILKQNQLIFLNRNYLVFCKLCSKYLYVHHIAMLYEHITCTSHFSAFVESLNIICIMIKPKYVNGIMTIENNKISYCLVCNFTLPSESAAAHCTSPVHEYLLPIFIEYVFSNHGLKYIHDIVVCCLCEKSLTDKSLNIFNIFDHFKSSIHVNKFERILNFLERFQQHGISYCRTCNAFSQGLSDTLKFEHTHSKMHYVYEYLCPKQLKKKK